ncbi:hypothetical protein L3X38_043581 [Prunus dulcis]|uniref:Isopenicillin N synthase-like Fe(2+) 2OG dioxygenase domain-containing protein n=1 Tax=Prunus dulcis TaxID=3755 RepID=A0AAD4UX05_PRUDU|nr:hypothetical protein L3X38_043581 [Prunus dulcis]
MNGLQVEHNGKWLTVDGPPNGFFVNLADQMQILTNELLEKEGQAPKYLAMNYKEYIQLQQSGKFNMKSSLDHIRV